MRRRSPRTWPTAKCSANAASPRSARPGRAFPTPRPRRSRRVRAGRNVEADGSVECPVRRGFGRRHGCHPSSMPMQTHLPARQQWPEAIIRRRRRFGLSSLPARASSGATNLAFSRPSSAQRYHPALPASASAGGWWSAGFTRSADGSRTGPAQICPPASRVALTEASRRSPATVATPKLRSALVAVRELSAVSPRADNPALLDGADPAAAGQPDRLRRWLRRARRKARLPLVTADAGLAAAAGVRCAITLVPG